MVSAKQLKKVLAGLRKQHYAIEQELAKEVRKKEAAELRENIKISVAINRRRKRGRMSRVWK